MYTFLSVISIVDPFFAIIAGLYVLLKNPLKNLNFSFFIFTWLIAVWAMISYALYLDQTNFTLYKFIYSTGGACFIAVVPFVLYLVKDTTSKLLSSCLYALTFIFLLVPIYNPTIMSNINYLQETYEFDVGLTFYICSGIIMAVIIATFYLLINNIFRTTGTNRKMTVFVLIGYSVFVLWEVGVGIIAPALNITLAPDITYGSIGDTTIFIALSWYALTKYHREVPSVVTQYN